LFAGGNGPSAEGSVTGTLNDKFAALSTALCNTGAFVYIPPDQSVDDPIDRSAIMGWQR